MSADEVRQLAARKPESIDHRGELWGALGADLLRVPRVLVDAIALSLSDVEDRPAPRVRSIGSADEFLSGRGSPPSPVPALVELLDPSSSVQPRVSL